MTWGIVCVEPLSDYFSLPDSEMDLAADGNSSFSLSICQVLDNLINASSSDSSHTRQPHMDHYPTNQTIKLNGFVLHNNSAGGPTMMMSSTALDSHSWNTTASIHPHHPGHHFDRATRVAVQQLRAGAIESVILSPYNTSNANGSNGHHNNHAASYFIGSPSAPLAYYTNQQTTAAAVTGVVSNEQQRGQQQLQPENEPPPNQPDFIPYSPSSAASPLTAMEFMLAMHDDYPQV